jgi:hypothetical protein
MRLEMSLDHFTSPNFKLLVRSVEPSGAGYGCDKKRPKSLMLPEKDLRFDLRPSPSAWHST